MTRSAASATSTAAGTSAPPTPPTAEFKNEPLADFSRPDVKERQLAALTQVRTRLGRTYDLAIGGKRQKAPATFNSTNPACPEEVIGTFQRASREQAQQAIEAAAQAFTTWSRVPAAQRSDLLFQTARRLRERRFEFNAWMILEVGKTWREADADTAEAIDFLDFYARENLRYAADQPLTRIPGEKNNLVYIPLGVGAVIPPWNFPLAIMAGMTTAAIVTGNTVVLKPASDSPAIAAQFFALLEECGLPAGVANFLTGSGGEVGNTLVEHPKTRFICFTGSRDVGLDINSLAAQPRSGQIWIKRVVAEMGGKDGIIVDDEADLDAAAAGVAAAAFGFQGQKCSACSRVIVVDKVYDEFVARLKPKVEALKIGDPADADTDVGPVINEGAKRKILEYVEIGKKEGKVLTGGGPVSRPGHFIAPTVVTDVQPKARLSLEEIFGPVLAVIRAKDYDDALQIANNTEYGLTGAVYSRNREKLERAKREFHVGNLYLNRKCTGAMVGVHPFGGFNMSGTDSKAGGRDYLGLFMQAKATSEAV
jgi:1-pyrroline-5-carboxylate dehydrogenase